MQIIARDNAIINYRTTGSGDKTLLFVHGSFINQSYWDDQVAFFSKSYTVVTLDLPGHGLSGTERQHWSLAEFSEDVATVIDELNLGNVILIGHSIGAEINLMVATAHPNSIIGFIAIDFFKNAATPFSPNYKEQAKQIEQQMHADFAGTNEGYARMALLTEQTPQAITERVVADYRNAYQPMGLVTTPEIFTAFEIERKLLPKLRLKLYLINVDYQPTNEMALEKYAASGYDLQHMPGTSHFPMLENPNVLNRLLQLAVHDILNDQTQRISSYRQ